VALLEFLATATVTRIVAPELRLAAAIGGRRRVMIVSMIVVAVRTVDVLILPGGLALGHRRLPEAFERKDPRRNAARRVYRMDVKRPLL
jgi:hypothetical protein